MRERNRFLRAFAVVALAIVCIMGFTSDTMGQNLQGYYNQGLEKFNHGDFKGASEVWERGLQLAKQTGNKQNVAVLLGSLGNVHLEMSDFPKALSYHEQALKLTTEARDRKLQGDCLGSIGSDHYMLNDYSKALSYYEQALLIAKETKNRRGEGANLTGIGIVYGEMGDYSKAISYYEQALKISKEIGDRMGEGTDLDNIGTKYRDFGDYAKALSYSEQALKIAKEIRNRRSEQIFLTSIGKIYFGLGDYHKAIYYYKQSVAIGKEIGVPSTGTESLIGDAYLEQGDLQSAYSIYNVANFNIGLGRYYLAIKDYQKARNHFVINLPRLENQRQAEALVAIYTGLGFSWEGLKDFTKAREYYLKAAKMLEDQRESLTEPQRRNFFSAKVAGFRRIEPYEGLVRVSNSLKDHEAALYWAENTKARLLLEAMAQRASGERLGLSAELSQKEADLNHRLAATQKQLEATFEKNPGRYRELEGELQGLKQQRQALIARLKTEYPEYASIHYPAPLRAKDFRLQPQEALIEYAVTDKATFAWLVRGGQVAKAVTIPVTRKDLTELAKKYRGFFEGVNNYNQLSRFDPKVGQTLYALLLKDLAAALKPGEPVIIIPDGILGIIPFEALVAALPARVETRTGKYGPYPAGVKYFGDDHPVSVYQSGTALAVVRTLKKSGSGRTDKMLVLADPDFGNAAAGTADYRGGLLRAVTRNGTFASLPSTRRLAERFKAANGPGVDLLLGAQATEEQLKSKPLQQYRYQIYATHGILDNEIPYIKEPALVLSQVGVNAEKDAQGGFLTMTKVMDLKLNADLVALTACNTGVGKSLTGEGVMGMGRAFQYAGSKSVLMSLWSVEDESTNLLTEKYFAHLKAGKDRLEALRLARLDLRQAGYEHPFFWAPFILVGER